jgi:hypothetical protein
MSATIDVLASIDTHNVEGLMSIKFGKTIGSFQASLCASQKRKAVGAQGPRPAPFSRPFSSGSLTKAPEVEAKKRLMITVFRDAREHGRDRSFSDGEVDPAFFGDGSFVARASSEPSISWASALTKRLNILSTPLTPAVIDLARKTTRCATDTAFVKRRTCSSKHFVDSHLRSIAQVAGIVICLREFHNVRSLGLGMCGRRGHNAFRSRSHRCRPVEALLPCTLPLKSVVCLGQRLRVQ